MADAAQNTASAPVDNGFESYRQSKAKPSDASQTQTADESEKSTGLGTGNEQETKGLTDEDKSKRKQRNDERRERRWFEERGQMREQMAQLQRELSELKAGNGSRTRETSSDVPPLQQYLNSGKFKTYEEAVDARQNDLVAEMREEIRNERSVMSEDQVRTNDAKTFQKNIKEFSRTHEDFSDAFDSVREVLDNSDGSGTALTAYLVKAKDGAALIYHLGNNPDLLEEISEMDNDDAIAELGAIRKELKAQKSPQSETQQPNTPKAPQRVSGRSAVPDRASAMREAADNNDFTAWRQAKHAARAKA